MASDMRSPMWSFRRLRHVMVTLLLVCPLACQDIASALAAVTCKPLLSIRNVRETRTTPLRPWAWQATIVADESFCATRSGQFEIDFIRIKEYSPDTQFTERYRWTSGQFDVSFEMTADESIIDYRIGFIAPCVCRGFPYDK